MATTPNYGWTLPTVGGDQNTWGGELNANWTSLDSILKSVASASTAVAYLPIAGGQMTGALYLQGNPTSTNMAANMGYVTGNFLPLTGGTISGSLTATGSISSGGGVWGVTVYAGSPAVSDFYLNRTSGNRILNWAANWYDSWRESDGLRSWLGPSGTLMSLNSSGNLSVTGSVGASGNVAATGNILISNPTVTDFYLSRGGGYRYLNWAANYADQYQESTGTRNWTGPAGAIMSLTSGGNLYAGGYVQAQTYVQVNGNGAIYSKWATNQVGFGWNTASTDVYVDGTHVGNIPFSSSDARLKNVIGPYSAGLQEIQRVQPVRFTFNDAAGAIWDQDLVHVGVVAQELEAVIPEAVHTRDDGIKHIGGTDSVLWALVNAVKELAAEVATLKAARA